MKVNWQENQDSSMVERQAGDLEVRIRVPVQIFLLEFDDDKPQLNILAEWRKKNVHVWQETQY